VLLLGAVRAAPALAHRGEDVCCGQRALPAWLRYRHGARVRERPLVAKAIQERNYHLLGERRLKSVY